MTRCVPFFFKVRHSDKRQVFDGLRGLLRAGVPSLKIVEKMAGSLSNLAAVSTCCPVWITEVGIYAVVTTAGKT